MTRPVIILACLAIAVAAARLAFIHDLPEWDQSTYFLVGDALLHGKHLYTDIWDMKPPGIFAAYSIANALTRSSFEWTGYLLSIFTAIGTTIAVFFCGAKWNRTPALLAATCFALVAIHPALDGPIPNTESFINLFLAIGFAIWLRSDHPGCGKSVRAALLAGCAFALATVFKQVAIAPIAALVLANIRTRRSILLIVPTLILWAILIAYFGLTRRFDIFWKTNFVYPIFYASNGDASSASLAWLIETLPLLALAFCAIAVPKQPARRQLIALLIGACIAIALPGRLFSHYVQLALVPLAIAGGISAANLLAQRTITFRTFPIIALLGVAMLQLHWFVASPRERAMAHYPASFFLDIADDGSRIRSLLKSDETMFCWCDEVQLYVLAEKKPIAAALWKDHTVDGPVARQLTQRTIEDLNAHPPDLVVLWQPYPGPENHPIYRWVAEHYDELPADRPPLALYARRGSALHAREIVSHDK